MSPATAVLCHVPWRSYRFGRGSYCLLTKRLHVQALSRIDASPLNTVRNVVGARTNLGSEAHYTVAGTEPVRGQCLGIDAPYWLSYLTPLTVVASLVSAATWLRSHRAALSCLIQAAPGLRRTLCVFCSLQPEDRGPFHGSAGCVHSQGGRRQCGGCRPSPVRRFGFLLAHVALRRQCCKLTSGPPCTIKHDTTDLGGRGLALRRFERQMHASAFRCRGC